MRAFDRDLIRGGHYGQRSCQPHLKAEHMAAPTNAANVKKVLANSGPSTHGTKRTSERHHRMSASGIRTDIGTFGNFPPKFASPTARHARFFVAAAAWRVKGF